MMFLPNMRDWKSGLVPSLPTGYTAQPVKYALNVVGKNWDLTPLHDDGGRVKSVLLPVPFIYRSGNSRRPGFLDERALYILGLTDETKLEKSKDPAKYATTESDNREQYLSTLADAVKATGNKPLQRMFEFLKDEWNPSDPDFQRIVETRKMSAGDWIALRVDGERLADMVDLREWWAGQFMDGVKVSSKPMTCFVCDKKQPILLRAPFTLFTLKGSAIGTANEKHLESYGLKLGENTPICFPCACKSYAAANTLLGSDKHTIRLNGKRNDPPIFLSVWTDAGESIDFDPFFGGGEEGDATERAERLLEAVKRLRTGKTGEFLLLGAEGVHSITSSPQRGGVRLGPMLSATAEQMVKNVEQFTEAMKASGKIWWGLWGMAGLICGKDDHAKRQLVLALFNNALFGTPLSLSLLPTLLRRVCLAENQKQRTVLRFLLSIVLKGKDMNTSYKLGRQVGIVVQLNYAVHRTLHGKPPASVEADNLATLPFHLMIGRLLHLREMNLRRLRKAEPGLAGWYGKRLTAVTLTEAETSELLGPPTVEQRAWFASGFLAERDNFTKTSADSTQETLGLSQDYGKSEENQEVVV